jgi:hypothetical protein
MGSDKYFNSSQYRSECPISSDGFSRTRLAAVLGCWLAVSECESDEQALAHRVISVSHVFQGRLLLMHFLVLGHIGFVAEVIEVASIRLRVEFRNERSSLGSKSLPVNLGKILMLVDVPDRGKALRLGCNTAV